MRNTIPLTPDSVERAARLLRDGALVAFPTETVYGLGADATNDTAVAKIFAAKNRPTFNPLIIHVADMDAARAIADISPRAENILNRFWPGALSAILPRSSESSVSRLASAGLDTLAIRMPAHDGARALLRAARTPIAAPSANSSGQISPTTAAHVAADLGDKVAIILDDGPCAIGLESTILDLSRDEPSVLRPGGVTLEAIESILGCAVARGWLDAKDEQDVPTAPGMLRRHYAPDTPVRLNALHAAPGEALLGFGPMPGAVENLSPSGDLTEAAARLFDCLHRLDNGQFQGIAVAPIPDHGLGRAINDRLARAAAR
jgi:L-threonylcarbamoyladenylate synthase